MDPAQLRRLGEELVYRADPDGVEERQQKRFERRHLSLGFTFDESGAISGMCGDALSLEIIRTAVDRVRAAGWGRGHPHRGAAADGRPDRRVQGRAGLRAPPAPGTAPPRT